jgi:protein O-mannosyl-transferase
MNKPFVNKTTATHLLLVILVGMCAYANTFHVPFLFDDRTSIVDNADIRELANFLTNSTGYSSNPRRYVGYLTFALNYWWGELDVTGYHAVNLAIHLANALLVYCLVRLTLRTPFFNPQPSTLNGSSQRFTSTVHLSPQPSTLNLLPLFASLFFVAHPVQTQSVTYIVQRQNSLMAAFYLLALILYVRMRLVQVLDESARGTAVAYYLAALVATVLAMKTKENAITAPVAIALYEWLFFSGSLRKRALRLIPLFATMAIIPLTFIRWGGAAVTTVASGGVLAGVDAASRMETAPLSRLDYLFTQFRVIVTYLRLLFFPVNQNLDYDYPLYHSFLTPPVLASFLLLAALFGLAVYLTYRSRFKVQGSGFEIHNSKFIIHNSQFYRLAAFGIFWFFLTLSVESTLIPIDDVIFEHRLYLPSVGFFIAMITLILAGSEKVPAARKAAIGALTLTTLILAGAAYARNEIWRDPLTLWRDTAAKSPNKARPLSNYATALTDKGASEQALPLLEKAIAADPGYADSYTNLGRIYLGLPQKGEIAVALFQKAITLRPKDPVATMNLGAAFNATGRYNECVSLLERMNAESGNLAEGRMVDSHLNLGVAYAALGEFDKAMGELEIARRTDLRKAEVLENYIRKLRIEWPAKAAGKVGGK